MRLRTVSRPDTSAVDMVWGHCQYLQQGASYRNSQPVGSDAEEQRENLHTSWGFSRFGECLIGELFSFAHAKENRFR